jgi:hypothetical protein
MGVEAQRAPRLVPQGTAPPGAVRCAVSAIGEAGASVAQRLRRDPMGPWLQRAGNPWGLGVGRLVCWGCLCDTEAGSARVGDVAPGSAAIARPFAQRLWRLGQKRARPEVFGSL